MFIKHKISFTTFVHPTLTSTTRLNRFCHCSHYYVDWRMSLLVYSLIQTVRPFVCSSTDRFHSISFPTTRPHFIIPVCLSACFFPLFNDTIEIQICSESGFAVSSDNRLLGLAHFSSPHSATQAGSPPCSTNFIHRLN